MLERMGFKDEGQFKSRKEKVSAYVEKELAGIDQAKERIRLESALLQEAKKILKQIETRSVVEQYQDVPGIQRLSYPEAQVIQAVNKAAGRYLSADEIQGAFNKYEGELHDQQILLNQIRKNGDRLRGANQWLEKHEAQNVQLRKLFQPRNVKDQLKADLDLSGRMMKEFGVSDRSDYDHQFADQQQAELKKPAIETRISTIRPGFNLLKGAVDALREVGRREQAEQQQRQWAEQRQRTKDTYRSQDQEYER
ncbi:TPA: hypothetical protein KN023_003653 [Clostridioides difficile]|nr:hypothetical protein [Clostridioides difficile]